MSDRTKLTSHLVLLIALCGVLYFPYLGNVRRFSTRANREKPWLCKISCSAASGCFRSNGRRRFHRSRRCFTGRRRWLPKSPVNWTRPLSGFRPRFTPRSVSCLSIFSAENCMAATIGLLAGAILATTMVYSDQALSARVDMTMCFFVTLSLILFYALYRGFLTHPLWYFALYALVGIGTLAKGPARNTFAGTRDRGISRGKAAVGSDRKIRLPSRSDLNFTARRRMVRVGDYPRRRRIRRSPTASGKPQTLLRRFRTQPSGLLLRLLSFQLGIALESVLAVHALGRV